MAQILDHREYLGHTCNFKTRKHFKDKKSHYVPESEWMIFENTHEPIIDQDTFDLVQKIRGNIRRYPNGWGEVHALSGLVYCADCGGTMHIRRFANGKRQPVYGCANYKKQPVGTLCSSEHRIHEKAILDLISSTLKAIMEADRSNHEQLVETIAEVRKVNLDNNYKKQKARLGEIGNRIKQTDTLLCRLYEDMVSQKISEERFLMMDAQFSEEQKSLKEEAAKISATIEKYEEVGHSVDRFLHVLKKYEEFEELSSAMLNELIDRIEIHQRNTKYGTYGVTQKIDIYFSFIGNIEMALPEKELTPEEAEAQRISEEKREKQRKIYQRRKETGKAKIYYERSRAKQKAKLEAAKEALRKEDQEKGVYALVKNLPKEEPRKAAI